MSEKETWRERIPTRQATSTLDNRQAQWLILLLPPSQPRDILLWVIPRLTFPALPFSIGLLISLWAPVAVAGWLMLGLCVPIGILLLISQSLVHSKPVLGLINAFVVGLGLFIVAGFLL